MGKFLMLVTGAMASREAQSLEGRKMTQPSFNPLSCLCFPFEHILTFGVPQKQKNQRKRYSFWRAAREHTWPNSAAQG